MKKFLLANVFALFTILNAIGQETISINPNPVVFGHELQEITITISGGNTATVSELEISTNSDPSNPALTADSGTTPALVSIAGGAIKTITIKVAATSADPAVQAAADLVLPDNTNQLFNIFNDAGGSLVAFDITNANLPVGIRIFEAKVKEESALLNWSTDWEINNDFYTVERSFDGRSFEAVDFVAGAGTTEEITDYSFVDEDLMRVATGNTVYYRVKQTDFDGQYSYTEVVALDIKGNTALDITTAVVSGDNLDISFTSPNNNNTEVAVVDLTGRIVAQAEVSATTGVNSAQLDLSGYNGLFIVRLYNDQTQTVRKFVK